MSYFAKVVNNIVEEVIVADQEFIDNLSDKWIETFNHKINNILPRKNFAGIGYTYDEDRDAFIPPQPYPSWTLNEDTCLWEAPVAMPTDGKRYIWNEDTTNWTEVV